MLTENRSYNYFAVCLLPATPKVMGFYVFAGVSM